MTLTDLAVQRADAAQEEKPSKLGTHDKYVAFIRDRCRTPGSRAALRSGLGRRPEQAHRMHPFVATWLSDGVSEGRERAYYTVAALIAAQPPDAREEDKDDGGADETGDKAATPGEAAAVDAEKRPVLRPNLGHSMAEAANRKDAKHESMERRLQLLARQDLDGIHNQLPPLIRYLRGKKVQVDWGQLLGDLCRWQHSRDLVAKGWLQTYYRTLNDPGFEVDHEADHEDNEDDTDNTEE